VPKGHNALHQQYLERVIGTVGRLTLANIDPQGADAAVSNADGAPLEEIYVDLPTDYVLEAEVKDYTIRDWWVATRGGAGSRAREDPAVSRTRPRDLGWQDEEGLRERIEQAGAGYRESRARDEEAKAGGNYYSPLEDGVHTAVPALSAGAIVAACRRLVVLGAPGSGKSTLVRHLALCLAGEAYAPRGARAVDLNRLPGWRHGPLTPVYIELRQFVGSAHFPEGLDTVPTVDHLWRYIRSEILGETLAGFASQLEDNLRSGHALLILDGLDEVPYPAGKGNLAKRQRQLQHLARSIDDRYGSSRVVVTSRPYAYENWQLDGYHTLHIAPFGEGERIVLAANLFRVSRYPDPEERATRLNTALDQRGIAAELADNPLFLTLMATIFVRDESGEGLPARKGALYRAGVLLLLERWTQARAGKTTLTHLLGNTSRDDLLARLAELAYRVHAQYGAKEDANTTPDIPEDLLYSILFKMHRDDPNVNPAGLLSYLSEKAGLLVSPGHQGDDPVFRFAHRTFQEYLAAKHLVEVKCAKDYRPMRDLFIRQPELWRAPCLLVGDVLRDTGATGHACDQLWTLVDVLLAEDAPEAPLPPDDPHWWPIWLAAAIVQEQQLYAQTDRRNRAVRDALVCWLVKLVETAGALPPQQRAHCGQVLGLLGDIRAGVGLRKDGSKVGLPDIEWGDLIPPGTYPIGGDEDAYQALSARSVELTYGYRLAKYPVTNAQFAAFVKDQDAGYNAREYWTDAGWEWKGDRRAPDVSEGNFSLPNHPRVYVTWYEAMAFCGWLSARYRALGLIDVGEVIGLPTEVEWELGARGEEGRVYPYGDTFDPLKGNVWDTGIGETSAVGIFPDGVGPYGVFDQSGNVWEWCLTEFATGKEGSNDQKGTAARVLRGGAWPSNGGNARAGARAGYYPGNAYGDLGFRVVLLRHRIKRI
jgi:formylglycine-generating enzyme required for sulfatase activity/energy-coupling factor transporter ATP-binding protein EcfA2